MRILHRNLKGRLPSGSKQLNVGDVHDIRSNVGFFRLRTPEANCLAQISLQRKIYLSSQTR